MEQNRLASGAGLVLLLWLFAFALLSNTYLGIIDLWSRSDTYAHGYVVLPISLFLVWRLRTHLQLLTVKPEPWALLFIVGCLFAWLLGVISGVQALEHLAAVTLLPLLVWGVMGNAFTRAILFPLCFLVFAVPIGDFLIEPMMEFTADFTVAIIRWLGIPVYREGLYFSLPSGNWSVVKACSGIRYIIASLTLGALYSYLNYNRYYKRVAFLLFSALVPVIANGMRAVIIVLIGHYSNMELATGADHLVYGWVFFGIVIFVMFWIGGYFTDAANANNAEFKPEPEPLRQSGRIKNQFIVAGVILLLLAGFRFWQVDIQRIPLQSELLAPELPEVVGDWKIDKPLLDGWVPSFHNPVYRLHGSYRNGGDQIGLYAAYFPFQNAKSELVSSVNDLAGSDQRWRVISRAQRQINGFTVVESVLKGRENEWLLWSWYQTSTGASANRIKAKLDEVQGLLTGRGSAAAAIVVYQSMEKGSQSATEGLSHFMASFSPQVIDKSAESLLQPKMNTYEAEN